MNVPEDLRYSSEHEWARRLDDGSRVRVGITDFAQDSLGDVVYVDLPAVGSAVAANEAVGELESTKLLNEDPYGDGWLCEIEMSDPSELDALMDAAGYTTLTEG